MAEVVLAIAAVGAGCALVALVAFAAYLWVIRKDRSH